jgi:hypothetical protein
MMKQAAISQSGAARAPSVTRELARDAAELYRTFTPIVLLFYLLQLIGARVSTPPLDPVPILADSRSQIVVLWVFGVLCCIGLVVRFYDRTCALLLFGILAYSRQRLSLVSDIQDYLCVSAAFWLAVLPARRGAGIFQRSASKTRVPDEETSVTRSVHCAWLFLLHWASAPWQTVLGGVLPESAARLAMGVIFALVMASMWGVARRLAAIAVSCIGLGLFARYGVAAAVGAALWITSALLVLAWPGASPLEPSRGAAESSSSTAQQRLGFPAVVAGFVVALLGVVVSAPNTAQARAAGGILNHLGMAPEFRWRFDELSKLGSVIAETVDGDGNRLSATTLAGDDRQRLLASYLEDRAWVQLSPAERTGLEARIRLALERRFCRSNDGDRAAVAVQLVAVGEGEPRPLTRVTCQ